MKKISEIIKETRIISFFGNPDINISSIQYDSRKCTEGTLFVAMRGTQADGHDFIAKAISLGASAVVCEEIPEDLKHKENISFILVENSRRALAEISHFWYGNPTAGMNIIGVTGTNGKTTITFLFKQIFKELDEEIGIIGTTGIFIGERKIPATHTTPESLELAGIFAEMKESGIKTVVMEVSSHALVQHRADCIRFSTALFTNLTLDHLDYHKTFDDYAKAKKILFDMLDEESLAIVFDNSPYTSLLLDNCKADRKLLISRENNSDIIIKNENLSFAGSTFSLNIGTNDYNFRIKLMGKFNVDNAAIVLSWYLLSEYNYNKIKEVIINSQGAPGRMQRIDLKSGAIAFVDYAHTPDALEKAIKACREILKSYGSDNKRLISVFGCGGDRDTSKRPLMGDISLDLADFTIVTSDNPRTEDPLRIIEDITVNYPKNEQSNYLIIPDRHEAIVKAAGIATTQDIILVAGKGHEDYQIIGTVKHHFDDVQQLQAFV